MWDVLMQQDLSTILLVGAAFIICGAELIKAIRVWREERKRKIDKAVGEKQQEINILEEFNRLHERLDAIDSRFDNLEERIAITEQKLEDLTKSDMHDIKAWIVEQYHKFYINQGWIDAFSAETLDRRYSDYKKEGGNSYIKNLMDQLHTLSMDPEQSIYKDQENKK